VVGAGLTGLTIARQLASAGMRVTIVEKRPHIGGNIFDYVNPLGITVHKYGPHIFHTKNERVINFVKSFAQWTPYNHKVKAYVSGSGYHTFPPNDEVRKVFSPNNIVQTFFVPYSEKMWSVPFDDIDEDVLRRLPALQGENDQYFPDDAFQGFPKLGYSNFARSLADHDNIEIILNTQFNKNMEKDFEFVLNCMPIDEYFDYRFGRLPYRSIKFHNFDIPLPNALPVPTVNFTHKGKYTRVTEWKNYPNHGLHEEFTTLTFEEPCDYQDNNYEPYYPVKDRAGLNREKYREYLKLVDARSMKFVGRCGSYTYLNMDQAINQALMVSERYLTSAHKK
jgi:UDP-galactopyranose mutase